MHRSAKNSFWTSLFILLAALSCWSYLSPTPLPAPSPGIVTDDSYSVEELVRDIFVTGTCNTVTNIQSIGEEAGIGYFEQGGSSLGISRGVVLATGPIGNARGPNEVTDKSGNFNDASGDPDLNSLATGEVKDAVGIEFDFTPLDSTVAFQYVFASEEYCEFVGSIYNDVFGFFISGPGINGSFSNGADNVAILPGTSDYVSINTVNYQNNPNLYVHNELETDANVCDIPIPSGAFHPYVEYDGFTTPLTAVLKLIPCETYHIRLVVSDVGDNFFDSAVFLKAESFNLGGEVDLQAATGLSSAAPAEEGCPGPYFRFERATDSDVNFPLSVHYQVAANSTATEGVDFPPLPGFITIPAGAQSADLPVTYFNDGLEEPVEQLTLKLDIPCACYADSATMFIADSPGFDMELPDVAICEQGTGEFEPVIDGGTPGFTYEWSTGATSPSIDVAEGTPGPIAVTVTDACGNTAADSAQAFTVVPPRARLEGNANICQGDTAWLPVQLEGTPPWRLTYRIDGVAQPPREDIWETPHLLPATAGGTYTLSEIADAGCSGAVEGAAEVDVNAIEVEAQLTPVSCAGGSDARIEVGLAGGQPPYDYFWLDLPEPALVRQQLSAGVYTLVITDQRGCQKEATFTLSAPAPLQPLALDCSAAADGRIDMQPSGGTPPYQFAVNGGAFGGAGVLETLNPGEPYDITVRDARGCTLQQSLIWPVAYSRMVELPTTLEIGIGQPDTLMPIYHLPPDLIASIRWTPTTGLSCFDCPFPVLQITQPATYSVKIVDIYGCAAEASVDIKIDESIRIFIPTAFSPNGDRINDLLNIFANPNQVKQVLAFQVFDRWGGQLYEAKNFPPNSERIGWDGTARGQLMDPGVYTYTAEIELTSGSRRIISGHVLLMR